ncbi:glycosyltransferase family 9 protein [Kineosporia sp. J2-2]|uniref:Glycosyltransferase family 9 protein n=1 Tax=Kineosporia corallincola TaxID=2835133 RepID=A0ABS5TQ80_9ACTN|nr:hypothetical protein [Kineosporia corallincola]MBT0772198.1 glycosyltransferase family 9 protein [Kineosporia corallincola]
MATAQNAERTRDPRGIIPPRVPRLPVFPSSRPIPKCLPPRLFGDLVDCLSPVMQPGGPRAPRSVLVIRTDEVAGLVMTLPLLTALRATWPQARITLVARGTRGELLRGGPLVDEVVAWPDRAEGPESLRGQFRCWRLARRLLRRTRPRGGRFDLALLPGAARQEGQRTARYVARAAARRVVGFDPADAGRDLLTDRVADTGPGTHPLRSGERPAGAVGVTITPDAYDAPGLSVIGPADRAAAATLLSPLAFSEGPVVAVEPGTHDPAVHAAALNQVHARLPVRVVLLGGLHDQPAAEVFVRSLAASVPLVSAVGRTRPRVTAALLAGSDLYLGGVGDAMHLASSVATPCVAVGAAVGVAGSGAGSAGAGVVHRHDGPWSAGSRLVVPTAPDPAGLLARTVLELLTGVAPQPPETLTDRRLPVTS